MLTLPITICPYKECSCITGLSFNVVGNRLLVLTTRRYQLPEPAILRVEIAHEQQWSRLMPRKARLVSIPASSDIVPRSPFL